MISPVAGLAAAASASPEVDTGIAMIREDELAAWLARREAAGDMLPHHSIRRGANDRNAPAKLVGLRIEGAHRPARPHRGPLLPVQ
jgi:hypothetical protein